MVEAVEEMHKVGYLHRDIKPDNFRIMNNKVVLIDFGLTAPYDKNGVHINRDRYGFTGTLFFASTRSI